MPLTPDQIATNAQTAGRVARERDAARLSRGARTHIPRHDRRPFPLADLARGAGLVVLVVGLILGSQSPAFFGLAILGLAFAGIVTLVRRLVG